MTLWYGSAQGSLATLQPSNHRAFPPSTCYKRNVTCLPVPQPHSSKILEAPAQRRVDALLLSGSRLPLQRTQRGAQHGQRQVQVSLLSGKGEGGGRVPARSCIICQARHLTQEILVRFGELLHPGLPKVWCAASQLYRQRQVQVTLRQGRRKKLHAPCAVHNGQMSLA